MLGSLTVKSRCKCKLGNIMENQIADSHYLPFVKIYANVLLCNKYWITVLQAWEKPRNYLLQIFPSIFKLKVQRKITSKCKTLPGLRKTDWQYLWKLNLYLSWGLVQYSKKHTQLKCYYFSPDDIDGNANRAFFFFLQ